MKAFIQFGKPLPLGRFPSCFPCQCSLPPVLCMSKPSSITRRAPNVTARCRAWCPELPPPLIVSGSRLNPTFVPHLIQYVPNLSRACSLTLHISPWTWGKIFGA